MFHWQIICGLAGGIAEILLKAADTGDARDQIVGFLACAIGTCAVFYIFFLCRMLGAGDIKLMALCTGILGVEDGVFVIFLGLLPAAVHAAWILYSDGILWERLKRLSDFVIRWGRDGKIREYPGRAEKERMLRLGPYLFLGYCLRLILWA